MPVVQYAVDRAIATVTLDSPENRNALSKALVTELAAHLATAAADADVRAVVLTHTGTTFCAGADLKEQSAEGGPQEGTRRMLELLRSIVELAKPVIARVNGHVRAGGLGLVGACDIAVAGPAASFAFTEVRLGLAPAIISLTTLGRMTQRAAARYYLTGETFDAGAAAACGIVTIAADDVDTALAPVLDALRASSPQGLAETKSLTTAAVRADFAARGDAVQALSARLFASDEAREGMLAFLERRPPEWKTG
ncbi:MAG TPA: enoyl-CoA hydratase family protein [Jatrophihabitantaceae bacterium]|nr:enoyl-CoA hydratase family protein [Jatrophihabitantaceae bacterium]